jgi:integrase/recombinase XerD
LPCFAIMYACGLRIGEAATLEVGAIDKANQLVRVIGKGNTERLVPLPQPVLDDLRKVWKTHATRSGCSPTVPAPPRPTVACCCAPSHRWCRMPASRAPRHRIATTTVYTHLTAPTRAKVRAILDPLMAGLLARLPAVIEVADVFAGLRTAIRQRLGRRGLRFTHNL